MSENSAQDPIEESEGLSEEAQKRREFLGGLGKWSSASVMAVVGSAAWLGSSSSASAWINRRGSWLNGRGGWVNGRGGGGSWVNRRGGGGWLNRR